jgi:CheY-specific phosphatase CheX
VKKLNTVASAPATEATGVVPRSAWPAALEETLVETFSIMAGTTIAVSEHSHLGAAQQVTGVVGITGDFFAIFSMRCGLECAAKIASQMLGVSLDEAGLQKTACDAVGELCNVVGGFFKAKIGSGESCKLTLPTVVVGGDYKVHSLGAKERIELRMLYENFSLWAALEIRN